jgi:3-deoxy-manno-octulosonate cytidylyltransferase (CMP-KDO synthetase)
MNKGAVVIPARYQSTRFPGKPLADIHGKSMIQHVYDACVEAVGKDLVYIATDSDLIKKEAESFDGNIIMTSEKCLTGTDRLAEVNEILELDFLVNVQGDEPMISPEHIKEIFNIMTQDSTSVLCCYCDIDVREKESPMVPKVVVSNSSKLLYMSRSGIPYDKELISHARFKQVCIYGFGRDHLKFYSSQVTKSSNEVFEDIEILRFLDFDIPVQMIKVSAGSYAVDTPEDLVRIRELML